MRLLRFFGLILKAFWLHVLWAVLCVCLLCSALVGVLWLIGSAAKAGFPMALEDFARAEMGAGILVGLAILAWMVWVAVTMILAVFDCWRKSGRHRK